jgi:predicted alpha/beta superfamily hydrolase
MELQTAATVHSSYVFNVPSENTGGDYQISVSLPASYSHKPETTFPSIYVIDGNLHFETVTGISRMMQLNGTLPEVVIISIGYPLKGFFGEEFNPLFIRRAKDLTAVVDRDYEQFVRDAFNIEGVEIETGGAEHFLKFITEELTPLVEERYRIDPRDRTLLGHSTGGHFTVYALLQSPQVFHKYAVGSPSLGFGKEALFELENEYAKGSEALPARVFFGIGEGEEHSPSSPAGYLGTIVSVSAFYRFAALLEERGYAGLEFSKKVFEGHGHTDVMGPFVTMGLKYLFSNA